MLNTRSIADILKDFSYPVDPSILAQKPVFSKGEQVGSVDYVHWYSLIDVLNTFAPGWSWEIRTQFLPDRCVIEGRLTLRAQEGEYFMEAVGVEMLDSNGYGDPVYSAEASALRRAMAKFGYGLDLWRKDKRTSHGDNPSLPPGSSKNSYSLTSKNTFPQTIKTTADVAYQKVTQKQLALLCTIANERELDVDTDLKAIVSSFGYESKKDIAQKDFDLIIEATKRAGKFLTLAQRKELADWWRKEGIEDAIAKIALERMGFNSTAAILRNQINEVKTTLSRLSQISN